MNSVIIAISFSCLCLGIAAFKLPSASPAECSEPMGLDEKVMDTLQTILRDPSMHRYSNNTEFNFDVIEKVTTVIKRNTTLRNIMVNEVETLGFDNLSCIHFYDFPCKPFKLNKTATSVHALTPADVQVVGAIGDSISAGSGIRALTPLGILLSFRGSVFSVGGDLNYFFVPTLPNILRKYNPNLYGYAKGFGGASKKKAGFDLAIPGAKSEDMLKQAYSLIDKMKGDKKVNWEKDWKVITLFIGGNDLCAYCKNTGYYSADMYVSNIKRALDLFHQQIPRAFINVVNVLDVSQIKQLNRGLICTALHYFECRCGAFKQSTEELHKVVLDYQSKLKALVNSGAYDTRADFTVVMQPFLEKTLLPLNRCGKADLSYFAPDCFHLSGKGNARAAQALWNNMIEPVGKKRTDWHVGEPLECPSLSNPYFYTLKNSK